MSPQGRTLLSVTLLSCAARPPRVSVPERAPVAVAVPARVFVQPRREYREGTPPCVLIPGESGVVRRIRDGWREEIRDGETHRAGVRLAAEPHWVVRDASGWHYFSISNRWRSDGFLDTPVQVSRAAIGRVGRGVGRPVVHARGAVEGMTIPGVVIDVAFSDESAGVALVEPGVALRTADAGATWQALQVDDVLTEVLASPAGVYVWGRQHVWRLEGGGLIDGGSGPERNSACEEDESVREVAGMPQVTSDAVWADAAHTAVFLDDQGTRYDLVTDRFEPALAPPCATPRRVPGSSRFFTCEDPRRRLSVFERAERGAWTRVGRLRQCGPRCVASPDGAHVACEGRCNPEAECDDVSTVCELTLRGPPLEHRYGDARRMFVPVGYDRGALVVIDDRVHLSHAEFIRGQGAPQRLCPHLNEPRWTRSESDRDRARLRHDGTLEFQLSTPDLPDTSIVVRPGGDCTPRQSEEAPRAPSNPGDPWERTCTRDGRSLAYREGHLWVRDRAQSPWRRFNEASLSADAARLDLALRRGDVTCSDVGLWMGEGEIAVLGWGDPLPTRSWELGRPEDPIDALRTERSEWRCTMTEETGELPPVPPRPEGEGRGREVLGRTRLWLGVSGDRADGVPSHTWLGFGRRGLTFAQNAMVWASRPNHHGAILGITHFGESQFSMWRVSTLAPPVHLGDITTPDDSAYDVRTATEGPVTALMWEGGMGLDHGAFVELLRVEGTSLRRSLVALSRESRDPVMVYVLRGEAGVARLRDDGSLVGGAPGAAPRVLARPGPRGSCGGTAEGAASVSRRTQVEPDHSAGNNRLDLELDFAFEGDRLCLRGTRDHEQGARFSDGALIVTSREDALRRRFTCRPEER